MDIGLPFYNGYYWCGEIRKISQVPIIFISSASDNMNVVMAVNMGGDDFVTKPFDLEILQAKIQALLRRAYAFTAPSTVLEYKGVLLNMTDMSLFNRRYRETLSAKDEGDCRIALTKNEFRILQTLFEASGGVVSRDMLMKRLWDDECFVDDNTLTVNMNRLRRKMVFFLPLVGVLLHTAAGLVMVNGLLAALRFFDTALLIRCCVGVAAGVTLLYAGSFMLTARTYYQIVKKGTSGSSYLQV